MSQQGIPLAGDAPANPGVITYDTPLGAYAYSNKDAIRSQITKLMLKGAGYAAFVFFGAVAVIVGLWAVGLLLPEASKEAPDPSLETTMAIVPPVPAA